MKYEVDGRCMDCQLKSFERLMNKLSFTNEKRQAFYGYYNLTLSRMYKLSMPEIHALLNDEFCKLTDVTDLYVEEKEASNKTALEIYNLIKPDVLISTDPFGMALRLSIAGNIMDYGASTEFDIHETIQKVLVTPFAIDHSFELREKIRQANHILVLGDNAGEIVFDKLMIELMLHPNVTYAVRGSAVLNDATRDDAKMVNMEDVADLIDNGSKIPSTILSACSPEFITIYNDADLIISKGQGNFEGLMHENDPRIYFLLMVKCDVVAEKIGVEKGSFVVYNTCR